VAHDEQRLRVVRLLVDQVKQILAPGVIDAGLEPHRVRIRCCRAERRTHPFPGLDGAPCGGAEHQVGQDAVGQQPLAHGLGIPPAAPGQLALQIVDPRLTARLGVPEHEERVPAAHRAASRQT
jgi:hypothetical protein